MTGRVEMKRECTRRDVLAFSVVGFGAIGVSCYLPRRASATPRLDAEQTIFGEVRQHIAAHDDTLLAIAQQYGLGYTELIACNRGIDRWVPGAGTRVTLPTAHVIPEARQRGLVLNLADQRLYHFGNRGTVRSYPIGIGRQGWNTPIGHTSVVAKAKSPTWHPPVSIREQSPDLPRVVPPGPQNPLGTRALRLNWDAYLIHGTNEPSGIGRRVSHGCVRLFNQDIEDLYPRVPVGTPVTVVNQPDKIGWNGRTLFLEVHPSQRQGDQLIREGRMDTERIPDLPARIAAAAGARGVNVDWQRVDALIDARSGVPKRIDSNSGQ